ncbi:hypothetical protein ACIQTZ_12540 [Paenarthrobacter sp. NPDC090520]|uniref:hypothetical protein n=1 Tax=Paenarthrobacter sp. NPDC090520 TaxID=3364382 RepID=UPI0038111D4B
MSLLNILHEVTDQSVSPEDVASVVAVTEPIEIRLDEVHAGPVVSARTEMQVSLGKGEPGYAYLDDEEVLLVRLEHNLSCFESSNPTAATEISAHHIAAFKVVGEIDVTPAVLAAWIETNVYFIAYPYVRQFFTQITSSLGLPPVVLGYIKRADWPFADQDVDDQVTKPLDGSQSLESDKSPL